MIFFSNAGYQQWCIVDFATRFLLKSASKLHHSAKRDILWRKANIRSRLYYTDMRFDNNATETLIIILYTAPQDL